jgi:hypothetical protein
MKVDRFL